jgi:nucleoside-triphosphatase THEP1
MNKQELIYQSYLNNENIFITGPGGTGKTHIIKRIYADAKEKNKKISVTALTGVAVIKPTASTVYNDVLAMKAALDKAKAPRSDRYLVLTSEMENLLLRN